MSRNVMLLEKSVKTGQDTDIVQNKEWKIYHYTDKKTKLVNVIFFPVFNYNFTGDEDSDTLEYLYSSN